MLTLINFFFPFGLVKERRKKRIALKYKELGLNGQCTSIHSVKLCMYTVVRSSHLI